MSAHEIFNRFKIIGDLIGANHLASWFYHAFDRYAPFEMPVHRLFHQQTNTSSLVQGKR